MKGKAIRLLSAAAAVCIFCSGCGSAQPMEEISQRKQLTLMIDSNAAQTVQQAAEEFVNRAEYYSDGELEIELKKQNNADNLAGSEYDLAFLENEQLSDEIEELNTLELPFFFKNADYQFSALNSVRTKAYLNKLLQKTGELTLLMATTCGYVDFAADAATDFTDYQKRYPIAVPEELFPEKIQQDIGAKIIIDEQPFALLLRAEEEQDAPEIAPASLSQIITAAKTEKYRSRLAVLKGPRQIKTAYLLAKNSLMPTLSAKQQAAVEQAAVMACGYCRTLSDQQRSRELKELEDLGVEIVPINTEKYFDMMGDYYQYQSGELLYRPDAELDRLVRSDGVKKTFSDQKRAVKKAES